MSVRPSSSHSFASCCTPVPLFLTTSNSPSSHRRPHIRRSFFPCCTLSNRQNCSPIARIDMEPTFEDPPSTSKSPVASTSAITRTRSGCKVCRKRRVKCDERAGTCAACERIHAVCEWEEPWTAEKRTFEARKRPRARKACAQVSRASTPCADYQLTLRRSVPTIISTVSQRPHEVLDGPTSVRALRSQEPRLPLLLHRFPPGAWSRSWVCCKAYRAVRVS